MVSLIQCLLVFPLCAGLMLSVGCGRTPAPHKETLPAIKIEAPLAQLNNVPKEVLGYMDIPWGAPADQVMKIVNPEGNGYCSGSSKTEYSFDKSVRIGGLYNTIEFCFSPDKAHLRAVWQISPWQNISRNDFEFSSKVCLEGLIRKFGNPVNTTDYQSGVGRFVIRHWKFPSTKIDFGELILDDESNSKYTGCRYSVVYQPRKTKDKWDIRNFLSPYQDRTTGEPYWKIE